MSKFFIRLENFGATVYRDTEYFFINKKQIEKLSPLIKGLEATGIKNYFLTEIDEDISNGKFEDLMKSNRNGIDLVLKPIQTNFPNDSLVAPIRIYFEINTACNGNCVYCLNDSGSNRANALSAGEIIKTIENSASEGVLEVRITGGEPTLHPDFFQIARTVQETGMSLSLNSNLLVSKPTIDTIVDLKPQLLITSLDASKESHERNRGAGYDAIVKNLRYLHGAGVQLRLNCMLNRHTLPYIGQFIDKFAPLGVGFCFILTRPVGRGGNDFNPPSMPDLIPVIKMINEKREIYPGVYISTSFHVVMDKDMKIGKISLCGCNAIQKSFNINSDGSVLPCAFLYELSSKKYALGNIRDYDYSALSIWRNSELLRSLRHKSRDCNLRCIACSRFQKDCLGTCVFMNQYSELTGNPDPYCQESVESAII